MLSLGIKNRRLFNINVRQSRPRTMTLQDVITWLRHVEDLACSVYSAAAESGVASGTLSAFLKRLAEDEAWHYHLMGSSAELIREQEKSPASAILVDHVTRSHVEDPLHALHEKIKNNSVAEHDILEAIVTLESSEWNDIFLYVINSCMAISVNFQYIAATIQAHEKRIEEYISSIAAETDLADRIRSLPGIWENQLLVVEDDAAVQKLLDRSLGRYGQVTTAENGEAALEAIRHRFFNAIVTDVDMPVRDGISFLRQAVQENDRLRAHFIICTGNVTEAVTAAAKEYGVPLLEKPVSIHSLWDAVERVLASAL